MVQGGDRLQPPSHAAPRRRRSGARGRLAVLGLVVGVVLPLGSVASSAHESLAAPVLTAAQPSAGTVEQPVWTISSPAPTTCAFGLQGGPAPTPVPCVGTFTGVTSGDGTWVLTVQAADGNDTSPPATTTYVRDATATVQLTSPTSPSQDRTPTWVLDLPAGATATCALTGAAPEPCAGSWTAPALVTDGDYQLTVVVTGISGATVQISPSAYQLDTTAPAAPAVTGMPLVGQGATAHWTWPMPAGDTATCALLRDGLPVRSFNCAPGDAVDLDGDAAWALQVVLTDPAGNAGPPGESQPYQRDTTPPDLPTVTASPAATGHDPAPVWRAAPAVDAAVQCRLLLATGPVGDWLPAVAGSCQADLRGLPDGPVAMQIRSVDAAGNTSDVVTGGTYVYDTQAPAPAAVSVSPAVGRGGTARFTVLVDPGTTVACRLTRPDSLLPTHPEDGFWSCGSSYDLALTDTDPEGPYVLEVRTEDLAGNASVASATYLLDRTAPAAPVLSGPAAGPGAGVAFHVDHGPGVTTSCALVHPDQTIDPAVACDPTYLLPDDLPDGRYVVRATATDAAGNVSVAASAPYLVDRVAPAPAQLLTEPSADSSASRWTWTWQHEVGTTVSCQLTGPGGQAVPAVCGDVAGLTIDTAGLAEGRYDLQLTVTDAAGNVSGALVRSYTLNRALPQLTVDSYVTPASLFWSIQSNGDLDSLVCDLTRPDGSIQHTQPCPALLVTRLGDGAEQGAYRLHVTVSGAGGEQAVDAVAVLDTDGPILSSEPVRQSTSPVPAWSVRASEQVQAATGPDCRVVGPLPVSGALPADPKEIGCSWSGDEVRAADGSVLRLGADGRYLLLLQARDLAGNLTSSTLASPTRTWILDRQAPPAPTLAQPLPASPGKVRAVTWSLDAGPAGTTTTCVLRHTGGSAIPVDCSGGSYTADLTSDGTYVLEVTRADLAGNSGIAAFGYTLDTTPPDVPVLTQVGADTGRDRHTGWTFPQVEQGGSYVCSLSSPPSASTEIGQGPQAEQCAGGAFSADLTGPDGTYVFLVALVDAAGNHGGSAEGRYTLDTTPPSPPTITGGPGQSGSSAQAEWTFDTEVGTTTTCQLIRSGSPAGPEAPCSSPHAQSLSRFGQGSYALAVRATDPAGNVSDLAMSTPYQLVARDGLDGVTWIQTPGQQDTTAPPAERNQRQYARENTPFVFSGPDGLLCELHEGPSLGEISPTAATAPGPCPMDAEGHFVYQVADPVDADSFAYSLSVSAVRDGELQSLGSRAFVLDRARPTAPVIVSGVGAGRTATNTWTWTSDEPDLTALCTLSRKVGDDFVQVQPEVSCPGGSYTATFDSQGTMDFQVRLVDKAGWEGPPSAPSYYVFSGVLPATPQVNVSPANFGNIDQYKSLTWSFPTQDGVSTTCDLRHNGTAVPVACPEGRFSLPLANVQAGVLSLLVTFKGHHNTSSSAAVDFLLSPKGSSPTGLPPRSPRPPVRPVGGTAALPRTPPVAAGPPARTSPPSSVPAVPDVLSPDAPHAQGQERANQPVPLLPTQIANSLVPAIGQVVRKPALPLSLLLVVVLFLLVQNRIDRRDPKLAAAPVEGEPELSFEPPYRPDPPP